MPIAELGSRKVGKSEVPKAESPEEVATGNAFIFGYKQKSRSICGRLLQSKYKKTN